MNLSWHKKKRKIFKQPTDAICDKFYTEWDNQVKDYCQVKSKHRGSAHKKCNVNFRLTNRILVVCERIYLSFIMQEIVNFEKNINVTSNNT